MHSNTLFALTLTLLTTPLTTALPLRQSPPSLLSPPHQQQQQQRPFIASPWIPAHRKFTYSAPTPISDLFSYPHPSPLATSTPLPSKDQPEQQQKQEEEKKDEQATFEGLICNLGHRTPVHIEDAVEVAHALCQGGIVDRSVVEVDEGEVWECLACEWGSWNADKGTENKG